MVEIDNGNSSGKKDELVANYKIFKAQTFYMKKNNNLEESNILNVLKKKLTK